MRKRTELYLRNIVFGICDSLVSTVGLLAGIDVAGANRRNVVMTGVIYALVEAFSMAVGSFLSEQSVEEYELKGREGVENPFIGGTVMFITFVIASFVPLAPYVSATLGNALWLSIFFSIIALFVTGLIAARIAHIPVLKRAATMALVGALAIVIGALVGKFVAVG